MATAMALLWVREWVTATVEDPGHMKENLWRPGMVIEAIVRDYEGNDQGSVVLYIITEAKSFGTFRCKCVAIEDAYFLWWMRDDAGHPDPGLWRPVFVPFDPTAGERESPPVIEVGRFRILSWGDSDVPTSLLGVRWLRPRLRLTMEAELEGYRATAGPKGVPLGDALTDFGAPGGKGKQKAKEKQAERSAAATGATSKGKATTTDSPCSSWYCRPLYQASTTPSSSTTPSITAAAATTTTTPPSSSAPTTPSWRRHATVTAHPWR